MQIARLNANGLLTDVALEGLANLEFVTSLSFGGTKRVTDDGLRHLAQMPQLEDLDFSEHQLRMLM